jgi:hypothetical protein
MPKQNSTAKNSAAKIDPDKIYVALESASVATLPGAPVVQKGTRLLGSNPFVQAAPWNFIVDAADDAERQARRRKLYDEAFEEPHDRPDYRPSPARLCDEDAVVAIRAAGSWAERVTAGERLPKDHSVVKKDRSAFVPVVPKGLARRDAVVALSTITQQGDEGTRVVYEGSWVHRDDELVRIHPYQFASPAPTGAGDD